MDTAKAIDFIIVCLEQKKIFIKDILDITKQIEVQSRQEEMEMEDLVTQRQTRIDRLKKCDNLIDEKVKTLDKNQREKWEKLVVGKADGFDNDDEQKAFALMLSTKEMLERINTLDNKAKENLQEQYEEAKRQLAELRKNTSNSSDIFNFK
ncbi:MAG: hypothetical protein GX269_04485 [Clostridiales bacterium]|nr:hypothetical protein [Clostridiales bacterium]